MYNCLGIIDSLVRTEAKTSFAATASINSDKTEGVETGVEMTRFHIDQASREVLDKERAEVVLKGLGEGTSSVKLGGKSFGDGSAEVVASALKKTIPSLRYLDIADIIASLPEEEAKRTLATIANALSACKHLEYIDLSDNALGAKGIRAVGDLLTGQKKLKELFLCNNGLAADAGALICSALLANSPTSLIRLHFHNNLLETAGSTALAPIVESSPALEDFRFSSLRLGREGAVRICRALEPRFAHTLKSLNLSDNSFGEEGAEALATALMDAPVLEKLILNDTLLGDDGVRSVCESLVSGAPKLKVLNVSGNEASLEGSAGLASLMSASSLEELYAEDNEFGSAGAIAIAKGVRKNCRIQVLTLNASEIGGRGAVAIAKAIHKVSTLKLVNLNGNAISSDPLSVLEVLLGEKLGSMDENDEETDEEDVDEDSAKSTSDDGAYPNGKTQETISEKKDIEKLVADLDDMKLKES